MANEELIYRITRAVYDRLGASADENTVEQLVTDIYRAVEPSIARNGATSSAPTVSAPRPFGERDMREGSSDRLIISVLDRKSTRLNSSHRTISYAVFCLKKKK